MAQKEGGAAIDPIGGGGFCRLLFSSSDEVEVEEHLNNNNNRFTFSTDKMLCFAAAAANPDQTSTTDNSSSTTSCVSSSSNSNIERNMESVYYEPVVVPTATASAVRTTGRTNKKMRVENTPPPTNAKVKKEKLGERIAALQQMVSPYGKTDTASVLHEAMGYIKFLHEQVHVLCSPYLERVPPTHIEGGEDDKGRKRKKNLKNRGLCLVPIECTLHMAAESNGADMWSPAMQGQSPWILSSTALVND